MSYAITLTLLCAFAIFAVAGAALSWGTLQDYQNLDSEDLLKRSFTVSVLEFFAIASLLMGIASMVVDNV